VSLTREQVEALTYIAQCLHFQAYEQPVKDY
jgi:hypothetical protein